MDDVIDRALRARIAALKSHAQESLVEARQRTAAARLAMSSKFEEQVRAQHPDWHDVEIVAAAGKLRLAHYLELARLSRRARLTKTRAHEQQ